MNKACDCSLKEAEKFFGNHTVHPVPMFKMETPRSEPSPGMSKITQLNVGRDGQVLIRQFMTHADALCFLQKGDRVCLW